MKIHLIRSAQVTPFVKVLENLGAPVQSLCERAGLPFNAVTSGKGVIGEYSAWRFIDIAARHERLDLFGYQVASQYPLHSAEGLGGLRMRNAGSLQVLIEYFIEDTQTESTGCLYSLKPDNDGAWFVRGKMFGDSRSNWQVEQYMIAIIIQIIRFCAGPRWLPLEVKVCATRKPQPVPKAWEQIDIAWGSENTEIRIPSKVLRLPLIGESDGKAENIQKTIDPVQKTHLEFKDLVHTQLMTRTLGLENAARQTGLSPTTLKRKLQREKTSYSKLLDQLRFSLAQSRLQDPTTPIHDIANELGYEHPANFTRAFKRMSGTSPQKYRELWGR